MATEVIVTLVGLFCTTVSSIVTFFLTRKKYNVEVDSQQLQNVKDSFDLYKNMVEESIQLQNRKIEVLETENSSLRQQVNQLQQQVVALITGRLGDMGVVVEGEGK